MTDERRMTASAPWPHELEDLVKRMRAYRGWAFKLMEGVFDEGQVEELRLIITVPHHDSYHPQEPRRTAFHYPVPMVVWDRASWQRWLGDMVDAVHIHEDGEAIAFEYEGFDKDGETVRYLHRPFAPFHGPGRDPNRQHEVGIDPREARRAQEYQPFEYYQGWWVDPDGWVHDDAKHEKCRTGEAQGYLCTPVQRLDEVSL
jgi:hypothetical protein